MGWFRTIHGGRNLFVACRKSVKRKSGRARTPALKRGRYTNLNTHPVTQKGWDVVMRELHLELTGLNKWGALSRVSRTHGLRARTLGRRYKKWLAMSEGERSKALWLQPGASQYAQKGSHRRIFTYEEARAMANTIDEALVEHNGYILGEDVATYATYNYRKLHGPATRHAKSPKFSSGWIHSFKQEWGFSSKKPRMKKCASHPMVQVWKRDFKAIVGSLTRQIPPERVFVMDETFWRVVCGCILTWCRVGEANMKTTNQDLKAGITVGYTVSLAGDALKPFVIKKGRSRKCLASLDLGDYDGKSVKYFSPSGWVNEEIFLAYISDVIISETGGAPCVLIYDVYGSHMTDAVNQKMVENNIQGVPIPPGLTAELSPLDVKVNGTVKSMGRRRWRQRTWESGDVFRGVAGIHRSALDAVELIYKLDSSLIRSAFIEAFGEVLPARDTPLLMGPRSRPPPLT